MKKRTNRTYLIYAGIVFLAFFHFSDLSAQNCAQELKKAQIYYDEGRITDVPTILDECIRHGFNKEELVVAYRLLTLTYLYLDEPAKAESSLLSLLRLNPEYKINSAIDPAEFINLYNKFRTTPIFQIGLKGGVNWVFFDLKETHSANGNAEENVKMESQPGFQTGVAADFDLSAHFVFAPELMYTIKEFKTRYTIQEAVSTYSERQNILSLPLMLKYSVSPKKDVSPYFTTGLDVNYLINANANIDGAIPSPTTRVTDERTRLNFGMILGAGLKGKIGPGNLSVGVRYVRGLNEQVQNVYHNNGTFSLTYGSVISKYYINTFNLNVGYLIPVYKPKKIK